MHRESIDVRFIQMEIQTRRGATTFRSGREGSCPGSHAVEGFAVVLLQPASFHGGKVQKLSSCVLGESVFPFYFLLVI